MSAAETLLQPTDDAASDMKWPDLRDEAKALFEQDKLLDHLKLLYKCMVRFPDKPAPVMMLSQTLRKMGEFDDADRLADTAEKRGVNAVQYRILKARIAKDRGAPDIARMHLIRAVAKSSAHDFDQQVRLLKLARQLEAHPAATIAASRILSVQPYNTDAQIGFLDSTFAIEAYDNALERLEAWIADPEASLELAAYALNADFQSAVDPDRARALKKQVRFRWPNHPGLPARVRWFSPEHGQAATLARAGQVDEALQLLNMSKPPENPNQLRIWDEFIATLKGLPKDDALQRPLIPNGGDEEVIVSPPGPSGTVVVFFCGMAAGAGMPNIFLDRFFAAKGWQSVFVRDYQRCCFVNGVSSVSDTLEGLGDHLAHLEAVQNASRVVVLSNSAGSIGAIRFALQIEADQTLCFCPVATLNERHREELGDTRQPRMTKKLSNLVPVEDLDVQGALKANRGHVAIDVVYPDGMPADVAHAFMLGRLPGVTLHEARNFERHDLFAHVIAEGQLDRVLDGDLSIIPFLPAS